MRIPPLIEISRRRRCAQVPLPQWLRPLRRGCLEPTWGAHRLARVLRDALVCPGAPCLVGVCVGHGRAGTRRWSAPESTGCVLLPGQPGKVQAAWQEGDHRCIFDVVHRGLQLSCLRVRWLDAVRRVCTMHRVPCLASGPTCLCKHTCRRGRTQAQLRTCRCQPVPCSTCSGRCQTAACQLQISVAEGRGSDTCKAANAHISCERAHAAGS